jgi:ABC-type enterochelin transport system substrate-binding protein
LSKIILFLLILSSGLTAFSQSPDCTKFREGKFRIADTRAGVVTIADRKGGYQTESSEALKAVVRFKISWQDNCSNMEIRVKIIETSAGGYTQETSSSLTNGTYKVEVTKIN